MADQLAGHWYSMLSNSSQVSWSDFVEMYFIHFKYIFKLYQNTYKLHFREPCITFGESKYKNKSTKWIFGNLIFRVHPN